MTLKGSLYLIRIMRGCGTGPQFFGSFDPSGFGYEDPMSMAEELGQVAVALQPIAGVGLGPSI